MGYIEEVHKENFAFIKKYNIEIGTVFTNGIDNEIVTTIHPLYGWITTDMRDAQKVPQEVSKIFIKGWKKI